MLECRACELHRNRKNVVFDKSKNFGARLVLIGEAPGASEDEIGVPFVGRSGLLLRKLISEIGISESDIYITNMVKCRPPKNRNPKISEINSCSNWLKQELDLLNPRLIVCVGRVSAQSIIDKSFSLSNQHGSVITKDNKNYMGIYHPAAVLRTPSLMPKMRLDLEKIHSIIYE